MAGYVEFDPVDPPPAAKLNELERQAIVTFMDGPSRDFVFPSPDEGQLTYQLDRQEATLYRGGQWDGTKKDRRFYYFTDTGSPLSSSRQVVLKSLRHYKIAYLRQGTGNTGGATYASYLAVSNNMRLSLRLTKAGSSNALAHVPFGTSLADSNNLGHPYYMTDASPTIQIESPTAIDQHYEGIVYSGTDPVATIDFVHEQNGGTATTASISQWIFLEEI